MYCGAIEHGVYTRIIIRKQMTEQERIQHRAEVRAHLIEQDKRTAFMRHLYHTYGRNNPDHPLHGHYSGLWQDFKEEAAYIVREQFFDRLEAVRLYEEEQEKKNSNVYTSSHPESDSNAVATGEPATA